MSLGWEADRSMAKSVYFIVSHSSAGGAQEIWANLADAFRQRGMRVQFLPLYPLRETVRETAAGLAWRYVVPKRPSTPMAMVGMLRALVRMIREERPDMLVTAMPAANVLAATAARLAGGATRVITSHHSPADTHNPVLNRLDSLAGSARSVRAVVSVSDTVARTLDGKPAAYRAKRHTIHNALPPAIEEQLAGLAARRDGRAEERTIVATGRLAYQKNYPLLIRAAVNMPDVRVEIVGGGPDEQALKALVDELGVGDRVHFLGHRPRAQALEILAAADLFVQVSHFEGHSLALIEAAKLGMPIIVSDVPVQVEGITSADGTPCGLTVGVDDPAGLAATVLKVLDDPASRRLWSERARMLGREATFAAMVDAYCDLIE